MNTEEMSKETGREPEEKTSGAPSEKAQKHKKLYGVLSLVAVILVFGLITWLAWRGFRTVAPTPEAFAEYIRGFGWPSFLVMIGIQILQVFVALIPGEVVEIGAGFVFGPLWGTLLCLVGVALGSAMVFLLVKKWGRPLAEIFVSGEKLDQLGFLKTESRLKGLIFLLYFIPGTPKDLLTYFVGLTRLRLGEFLAITLTARIPSIVTSTIGGSFVRSGDWFHTGVVFGITALVSLAGILIYRRMLKRRQQK